MEMKNLEEFSQVVEDIIGLYYDSMSAYAGSYFALVEQQEKFAEEFGMSIEEIDTRRKAYATGHPSDPDTQILHSTTQGQFKANHAEEGKNALAMGNISVCQIFAYWEDGYRGPIAKDFGIDKKELLSDIFGDIRQLRNDILHHRGIATNKVTRYQLTKWFDVGDSIRINQEKFEFIVSKVREEIQNLQARYTHLQ
jgi:hypothetical protein